jgi:F0F1-type ATP synthase epsilon subunit
MTESGEITILPGHEALLSAIRPGVLSVDYYIGGKVHSFECVTGGGVLNISSEECVILVDAIHDADTLTDLEYIESQKKEAEMLIKQYHEENGTIIDPNRLIEIEYELLKYTAMHRLGQKYHEHGSTRK